MEQYKSVFDKLLNILTCGLCMNRFSDPVLMYCGHNICLRCAADTLFKENKEGGCSLCPLCRVELGPGMYMFNHQLGKAAQVVEVMKEVIAEESSTGSSVHSSDFDSESDSGVESEDGQSGVSSGTDCMVVSMEPSLNMVLDTDFINPTLLPRSLGSPYSVGSPCSIASIEPPPNMAPDKISRKKQALSPCSRTSSEPLPGKCPGTGLETNSFPDVDGISVCTQSRLPCSSLVIKRYRRYRIHPYMVRPDRTQSPYLNHIVESVKQPCIYQDFINDLILTCHSALYNSTSVPALEHLAPTDTARSPGPECDAVSLNDDPDMTTSPCGMDTGDTRGKSSESMEMEPVRSKSQST